jgi:hypothetical protein
VKRASGDREARGLLAGTRQSQSGEKRRAIQVICEI